MTEAARTRMAAMLECLAQQYEAAPVTVRELGDRSGLTPTEADILAPTVLALLAAFGVLREETASDGTPTATVISPQAAYFLGSLAAYLRTGDVILDNWERAGAEAPPYNDSQVLAGPQFLYLAESRRLALNSDAVPLRQVDVVQVVIKTRHQSRGTRDQYLLQYDERARQYQLPGGHVRSSDANHRAAAIRELEEELAGYVYRPDQDVLTEIGVIEAVQPSRTYGAVTAYHVTFFHLKTDADRLLLGPGARWAPADRFLDPAYRIGRATLNITALSHLDATLPGGLQGLPLSISEPISRTIREVIRERPWEAAGLAVGIIGLMASLIPLFL
ncbi:NUDIX hydrolase [Streptomyces albogriseolus]|uniref:NUDIX hydrolase n=1 Tax=Streptomyces albogriseolus TaxID=1887 RepID=UPI003460FFB4